MDGFQRRLLMAAMLVAVGILWIVPMFSSLWLDELVTSWVVSADLSTTIRRAIEYQQSPLYYVVAWASTRVVGTSEFALRLPSLIFSTGSVWLLWRSVRVLHGRDAARLAAAIFVVVPWMTLVAVDARPYALADLRSYRLRAGAHPLAGHRTSRIRSRAGVRIRGRRLGTLSGRADRGRPDRVCRVEQSRWSYSDPMVSPGRGRLGDRPTHHTAGRSDASVMGPTSRLDDPRRGDDPRAWDLPRAGDPPRRAHRGLRCRHLDRADPLDGGLGRRGGLRSGSSGRWPHPCRSSCSHR